jgi:catechol 2,3-dioxygenase-like lactoylglutathione lyase family enzyme
MFNQKKKAYYSKILGFKNIDDFGNFAKRYLKYLKINP